MAETGLTLADIWSIGLAIASLAISIAVGVYAFFATRPIEQKQMRLATLSQIMSILSTREQRDARGMIYDLYCGTYPNGRENAMDKQQMRLTQESDYKDAAEKIISAFDQVGVLVGKKLVEPDHFYELYAGMVVRVYEALREHIDVYNKLNSEYARWFIELNSKCTKDYFEKKNQPIPKIYCQKPL